MNWRQFDQMQLDDQSFAGPEVDCVSAFVTSESAFILVKTRKFQGF